MNTRFDVPPETPSVAMLNVEFTLRFYNEREVGTSVGPLYLEVSTKEGEHITSELLQEAETGSTVRFMDLPPQASAWKEIGFTIEVPNHAGLVDPELQVRWRYPDGNLERQTIPTLGFKGSTWDSRCAEYGDA